MAEIDEAAAVEWAKEVLTHQVPFTIAPDYNLARAALAWKARADIGERWEKDSSLSTWFPLTAKEIDDLRSENRVLVARAEEAEAERDAANARLRVMESRMRQINAALLASMSDEQLAQSVKAR